MVRFSVSLVTALYALGFAFVALAAVRWPSVLAAAALFGDEASQLDRLQAMINWRELGIVTSAPYFFAAFCFYTSATLLRRYSRSAIVWFVLGAGIGFPPFILFDFAPGWWQNPDPFEQGVMFAGIVTFFLFGAVLDLCKYKRPVVSGVQNAEAPAEPVLLDQIVIPVTTVTQNTEEMPRKKVQRRPVPAAIARQRASFAAHGRRALARQAR